MITMTDAIMRKCRESIEIKEQFFRAESERIVAAAETMADAFRGGRKLLIMGNGGSACDAQHVAIEFTHPIIEKRRPLPAIALSTDSALLTAIGNDTDFSRIFSDQVKLLGDRGDMALGITTSGHSANVIYGLQTARDRGLLTLGFAGMDGGEIPGAVDYSFVVPSFSIHRIQETHVALLHVVWDLVHLALGEEDVL